ncbi:MAG: hypothetical protein DF221_11375 [Brevibacillus sp.]|jgi:hypothetical protein|nr:MAG: hypothetical protein DF221_11375 [Brevibacillus sp.]
MAGKPHTLRIDLNQEGGTDMADERQNELDRTADTSIRTFASESRADAEQSQEVNITQEQVSDMYKMGTIDDAQGLN